MATAPDAGLWWMLLSLPEHCAISFTLDLLKPCQRCKAKLMSKCSGKHLEDRATSTKDLLRLLLKQLEGKLIE